MEVYYSRIGGAKLKNATRLLMWFGLLATATAQLTINEIYYRPAALNNEPEVTNTEFIELFNPTDATVAMDGWQFTRGVSFNFPNVSIPAGGFIVIAADPDAFAAAFPDTGATVVGPWEGTLSNSGERIELRDASGDKVDEVRYANDGDWGQRVRDPEESFRDRGWAWTASHNGEGASLELINSSADNESGQNWGSSSVSGGTPGSRNSIAAEDTAPFVSEVRHFPAVPTSEDTVSITAHIVDAHPLPDPPLVVYRVATTRDPDIIFDRVDLVAEDAPAHYIIPGNDSWDRATPNWRMPDFDSAGWITGQQGIGHDSGDSFLPFIGSNIRETMWQVNSSVYIRIPFEIASISDFRSLFLQMRYDDGFIAYLNGVEIARANAPENAQWDARSTSSNADSRAVEFEEFPFENAAALLRIGQNVLSIHGLNSSAAGSDALFQAKLQAETSGGGIPAGFETAEMYDDGEHDDEIAGDSIYGAQLPPFTDNDVVEFFILAGDGTRDRAWPAPTDEGATANALFLIEDTPVSPNENFATSKYHIILTPKEESRFRSIPTSSDTQMNATFIAETDSGTTIRYRAGLRIRGNSSRFSRPTPVRINLPSTDPWNGKDQLNLNNRSPWLQLLGMKLFTASGLRAPKVRPVLFQINDEAVGTSGDRNSQPAYVHIDQLNEDYLSEVFPHDDGGNMYKKNRPDVGLAFRNGSPGRYMADGWAKRNNESAWDWSDLDHFLEVFNTDQNGEDYIARLESVMDVDQWLRWFAINNIIVNSETNISNGVDDDYTLYFGQIDSRARLVPHDLDSNLGQGLQNRNTNFRTSVFDMIEEGNGMRNLRPLMESDEIRIRYFSIIRELLLTTFRKERFDRMMEENLRGWIPERMFGEIIEFMDNRRDYLTGLLESELGPTPDAPVATSLATLKTAPATGIYLSEILAINEQALKNGESYPDYIELHNASGTTVSLGGMTLTDDPDRPDRFTFPVGTTMAANGRLLVFADSDTGAPGLHAGFSLDGDGEQVLLYQSSESGGALLDSVQFGIQIPDASISRTGALLDEWRLSSPTPGAVNSAMSVGSISRLRINEWLTHSQNHYKRDFVEIYNNDSNPVAIGGIGITTDLANAPHQFRLPELSFIAPEGYSVFYAEGNSAPDESSRRMPFAFSADYEWITLTGSNEVIIDQVDRAYSRPDRSYGTSESGERNTLLESPTPGWANSVFNDNATNIVNSLRITEIMYNPGSAPNAVEYIELFNTGTEPLQLEGVEFSEGISFTFPQMTLLPGNFVLVVADESLFRARYGDGLNIAGTFTGKLDNGGETLRLQLPAPFDAVVQCFRYEDEWFPLTDGAGESLTIRNYLLSVEHWDSPSNWQSSTGTTGSPGQNGPPVIIGAKSVAFRQFYPLEYQITVLNGAQTYNASPLPAGLTVNETTGRISGNPEEAGEFTIGLSVSNSQGSATGTVVFQINETLPPEITSGASISALQGNFLEHQIQAAHSPDSFSAVNLPAGLSLNAMTGEISGSITEPGQYPVELSAINRAGIGSQTWTLTITSQPVPVILNNENFRPLARSHFNFQIVATESPTSFAANGLPEGMEVDTDSGLISGAPLIPGTYEVELIAINGGGAGTGSITLTVVPNIYAEVLDVVGLNFSEPDSSWLTETTETFDGEDSLRSRNLSQFDSTSLELSNTSPDTLFFYLKFDTPDETNEVTLFINGQPQFRITQPTDWREFAVPLPHSFMILEFRIIRNGDSNSTPVLYLDAFHLASSPEIYIASSSNRTLELGSAFNTTIEATQAATSFEAENLPDWLTLNPTTGTLTGTPLKKESASFSITARNQNSSHTKHFTYNVVPSVDAALGAPGLTWTTGGSKAWFITPDEFLGGTESLRSGQILDNQASWIQTEVSGPDLLSYSWRSSSEACCDQLTISVDDIVVATLSNGENWSTASVNIPDGLHTVRWTYTKDGSVSAGQDAAWIDNVFLGSQPLPTIEIPSIIQPAPGPFHFPILTVAPASEFRVLGLPPGLTLDPQTGIISGILPSSGVFDLEITAENSVGRSEATTRIEILPEMGLGHDSPARWIRGGDALWATTFDHSRSDGDSLQSGTIGDNEQAWVETTIMGPAFLSFWMKTSSANGDTLRVEIDNNSLSSISGTTEWHYNQYYITEGLHNCRFTYQKNGQGKGGLDTGFVDEFNIAPLTFASWLHLNQHSTRATEDDDSDGDGVSNGIEFALNGSRISNDNDLLPHVELAEDLLSATVTIRRAGIGFDVIPSLNYFIETSSSLSSEEGWTSDGAEPVNGTRNQIIRRFPLPNLPQAAQHYFRLRVE